MHLDEWEVTIQKIIDECNHEQMGMNNVLMKWRVKLEKEPPFLRPFEIDKIVRVVWSRLNNASPRATLIE